MSESRRPIIAMDKSNKSVEYIGNIEANICRNGEFLLPHVKIFDTLAFQRT